MFLDEVEGRSISFSLSLSLMACTQPELTCAAKGGVAPAPTPKLKMPTKFKSHAVGDGKPTVKEIKPRHAINEDSVVLFNPTAASHSKCVRPFRATCPLTGYSHASAVDPSRPWWSIPMLESMCTLLFVSIESKPLNDFCSCVQYFAAPPARGRQVLIRVHHGPKGPGARLHPGR